MKPESDRRYFVLDPSGSVICRTNTVWADREKYTVSIWDNQEGVFVQDFLPSDTDFLKAPSLERNETILEAMARAFFVSAWADLQEEEGSSFSQMDLMCCAPVENDPAAVARAIELYDAMLQEPDSCDMLLNWASTERREEALGRYAAMQSMGHGVCLSDNYNCIDFIVPYSEFSSAHLELDYAVTED